MPKSIDKQAERLINLMQVHSAKEVNNNAIQSIHRIGVITEVLTDNNYKVKIDEQEYIIEARQGLTLTVKDVVYILLCNGDINRKIIDFKKPKNW